MDSGFYVCFRGDCTFDVPVSFTVRRRSFCGVIREHYILYVAVYLISGVMGLAIVFCLRKMMKTVISQDCFVDENVRELKIMGTASFVIAAAFLVKTIFAGTVAGVVIIVVFLLRRCSASCWRVSFQKRSAIKRK